MILVVDVGNTNIVLGLYEGEKLLECFRMSTKSGRTADETGTFLIELFQSAGIAVDAIENAIIASVVPDIMYSLTQGIRKYLLVEPIIVNVEMETGILLNMDNPKTLGIDRLVNMAAAYALCGGPAVVIDYGTCTTYDVVDENGTFITGYIAPGIRICADALYQRAAQLPKIEIKRLKSLITKNTVGSIQAGVVMGKVGETVYIIEQLKKQLHIPDLKVVATGGLARVIDEENEIFDVLSPTLTLDGLRLLYEKNKEKGGRKRNENRVG